MVLVPVVFPVVEVMEQPESHRPALHLHHLLAQLQPLHHAVQLHRILDPKLEVDQRHPLPARRRRRRQNRLPHPRDEPREERQQPVAVATPQPQLHGVARPPHAADAAVRDAGAVGGERPRGRFPGRAFVGPGGADAVAGVVTELGEEVVALQSVDHDVAVLFCAHDLVPADGSAARSKLGLVQRFIFFMAFMGPAVRLIPAFE
mmetsp:Transcript_16347/g.42135  ORF Transcript_16347/g.42135 Transcript_16347/m.42135 type:complete len:204 (+) Transcript_16347:191-802(+)